MSATIGFGFGDDFFGDIGRWLLRLVAFRVAYAIIKRIFGW